MPARDVIYFPFRPQLTSRSFFPHLLPPNPERQDSVRFEAQHSEYEKKTLDEVQVYRDVRVVEDRRRVEGKPPKARFFTAEEQRQWERQYPKRPGDVPQADGEANP
jgi:hypothetical protein